MRPAAGYTKPRNCHAMDFNLHTHTHFSDGGAAPDDYLTEALRLGFRSLGFSDHGPLPFHTPFSLPEHRWPGYLAEIQALQQRYRNRLDIWLGLEVDFIPGAGASPAELQRALALDYRIGSVHLVANPDRRGLWFIDGPNPATFDEGLRERFDGDIQAGVGASYGQIQAMVREQPPDVVGHLDKIKMHGAGRHFSEDEPWYRALVEDTLAAIQAAGLIVEVNTRGIYQRRCPTPFPGPWVLERILALGIPVTVSSDAHRPAELGLCLEETVTLLKELGFREQMTLTRLGWAPVDL